MSLLTFPVELFLPL